MSITILASWAIVKSAAMTFRVRASFQISVFSGYMPRSGIVGSYGSSIFVFFLSSRGLSHCGTQAQPSRGLRNLPGAGTEPVSPALAGGFSPTVPPGKSINNIFISRISL